MLMSIHLNDNGINQYDDDLLLDILINFKLSLEDMPLSRRNFFFS